MRLVERDDVLATLDARTRDATEGRGSLTVLAGEAGMGKTSVVSALVARHAADVRTLVGACDDLSTPRPLGPLWDMVDQDPGLRELLDRSSRHELFVDLLARLSVPGRPVMFVLEDVHWSDAATLDLLRYLGRRVGGCCAMVLVTYRPDAVGSRHPLRDVLGDLATVPAVRRTTLAPLTPAGVAALTDGTGLDPATVHRRTGGNPFFVSEVAAHPTVEVPETVRDAVLARANRLPAASRVVLEAVSIVPGETEPWLLERVVGPTPADVDACVDAGILAASDGGTVTFRHELGRRAVHDTLLPARRASLHAAVVQALVDEHGDHVDPARMTHHADAAGDAATVLRHAVAAADAARARGAYRQAADHLALALRHAAATPDVDPCALLAHYVRACDAVEEVEEPVAAAEELVARRRAGDDPVALGEALRLLGTARWNAGVGPAAHAAVEESLAVLEPLGDGPELAEALSTAATLAMLARRYEEARRRGHRAIDLATRFDLAPVLARALNSVGAVEILTGHDEEGEALLLRSRDVARSQGNDVAEVVALTNLGSGFGEVRRYERAERYLEQGIAFATERDLDTSTRYGTAWLARVHVETGRWDSAERLASSVPLSRHNLSPIVPITVRTVLGRLAARRGDPGVADHLDEAWTMAVETDDLQRLWPVAAARAEAAWLEGRDEDVAVHVRATFGLAVEVGHPWAVGELGTWAWRVGQLDPAEEVAVERLAAEPYRLQVAGDVARAAAAWRELGCPYETAEALADGDESQQREALEILDDLGAGPAAARLRRRMRADGVRSVPRGPRPSTAVDADGLTPREVEVYDLVAAGMTNADIAAVLFISEKTAGHHVSAILRKLGVATRQEAARRHASRR